ncbi:MAG: hypothetical protein ACD_79C01249G0003 [uncultured bacterium]|nr:MAG: hypothetical protein ACD_79C01249G0003 [uncultured bacterium]
MRTTVDLPQSLLQEAHCITKIKTNTDLIIIALKELIRKNKILKLKDYKGKIDLKIDLNALRKR